MFGHVAVAAGSSMRPRIPKNAPGTPVHGSGFAGPADGTHCASTRLDVAFPHVAEVQARVPQLESSPARIDLRVSHS